MEALLQDGPPDHVFASLGPWWQGGPLARQPPAAWRDVRAMLLDGHVHAAALLLPSMTDSRSSYTVVTGMGAHQPMPGTSLLHVATAGVLGLSRVLRAEHAEGVRVNELLIATRVEKSPRPGVVPSEVLGQAAVELATGTRRSEIVKFPEGG